MTRGRLWALMALACALRLAVRLPGGPGAFLDEGYAFYGRIATTFVEGHGLCVAPGIGCALRVPGYAVMLVPFVATGTMFPGAVVLQAVAGAGIVWATWTLAAALCSRPVAWMAAWMAAVSPYAVVHDTALQDTVVVNLLTMMALVAVVRAARTDHAWWWALGGAGAAAVTLTSARMAPLVAAMVIWAAGRRGAPWRERVRHVAMFALPVLILVGGWVARNWVVVGAPVLTTEVGASLYYATNPWTFSAFPAGSIDRSAGEAVAHLDAEQRAAMAARMGDPVAEDRLAASWAWEYIRSHPANVAWGAFRKVWVVVSAEYSPARDPLVQWGYRLVFGGLHLAAVVGLWRARRSSEPHGACYAVLAAVLVTSAVFWAHTSHKSVIDAVLFIYAAAAVSRPAAAGSLVT